MLKKIEIEINQLFSLSSTSSNSYDGAHPCWIEYVHHSQHRLSVHTVLPARRGKALWSTWDNTRKSIQILKDTDNSSSQKRVIWILNGTRSEHLETLRSVWPEAGSIQTRGWLFPSSQEPSAPLSSWEAPPLYPSETRHPPQLPGKFSS